MRKDKCERIFLIGFMGTGKTTISKKLKEKLKYPLYDTDAMIVEQEGMNISEIFEKKGEAYFRQVETEIIKKFETMGQCIVSCGGGVPLNRENVAYMRHCGKIVCLKATPQTVFEHVRYGKERPLLKGNMNVEYIEILMKRREPAYQYASDITVTTDGKELDEIAGEIIEKLNL